MKKSTFILSLLLAFLGVTATAQTFTGKAVSAAPNRANSVKSVDAITSSDCYVLYNMGRGKYMTLNPADRQFLMTGSVDADRTSMLALFQIESVEEDGQTYYTFKVASSPAGEDYFIPVVTKGGNIYANTNAEKFSIIVSDATNGYFFIQGKSNNFFFNGNSGTFTGWDDQGDNSKYQLVPVELGSETYSNYAVSSCIKVGEEVKESSTSRGWGGDTFASSLPYSYYYAEPTLVNGSNVIGEGNTDFVYTTTFNEGEAGTVPVSFSTASNKTWYAMHSQNNSARILIAVNENATYDNESSAMVWHVKTESNNSFNSTTLTSLDDVYAASWAFIEDGLGVKLYNKQAGKYVKCTDDGAAATLENNGTRFYFHTSTNGKFSLWTGSDNHHLGSHASYNGANKRLSIWNESQDNSGSAFGVADVDVALALQYANATVSGLTPNESDATYLTAGLAADKEATATAMAAATNYEAIDEALANLYVVSADIDANAYYRIGNVNLSDTQKKYVSSENIFVGTDGVLATAYYANTGMDRIVRRVPATGNFTSMLWKLEKKADGAYLVRNANTGCNLSDYVSSGIDMPVNVASGGSYTFKAVPTATFDGNDGKTMLQILVNGYRINAFQGNDNNIISDYNGNHDNDKGNYWQFEKVTSVPVSISDALYASVGFPFAVQVPAESGVKAYYATAAGDGQLTLTEIEDGIIPAYTGAILAASAATDVNLTITTTDKTLDNKLVAATAKRTGFAAEANYMLGVDSDSEVKFLQATITTVPANKAYLPAANVTNSSYALAFNFGGESTGIATSLKDNEEVQYFDLNGRVVLYPSNGVFITNTGKKVFIK